MTGQAEEIRALATVTLDARALEELGPQTIDRLADLVAARLAARRDAGQAPMMTVAQAAEVAGVHAGTIRTAIRRGQLPVAGYVGKRPRLRREDLDAWVASGRPAGSEAPVVFAHGPAGIAVRQVRKGRSRVLSDALAGLEPGR